MTSLFFRRLLGGLVLILSVLVIPGCAGDPDPAPEVPTVPEAMVVPAPPEPEPAPPEEVLPEGHAPLVETRWALKTLHGDMRTLLPPDDPVWLEFRADGTVFVQGPVNTMTGGFTHRVDEASPKHAYNFQEGLLRGEGVNRHRRAGTFSDFEDVLLENMQLLKGYYIRGETHAESTLTIWGGYRSEEVILLELAAVPDTHAPPE
jgi:hypothetical protein